MTSNTRKTIAGAYTEIAAIRTEIADVKTAMTAGFEGLFALIAANQAPAPLEVTVPTVQGTVLDTITEPTKTKASKEVTGPKFQDLRNALKAHKANGLIKAGLTVKECQAQGLMDADGNYTGDSAPAHVVVAETVAAAPAAPVKRGRTEAQIAAAKETASGPRDAAGHITPKNEWTAREALAMTGRYDRKEIDAFVTLSYSNPSVLLNALNVTA